MNPGFGAGRSSSVIAVALALCWQPAAAKPVLPVQRIADGVHVHLGQQQHASAANGGDIANLGFIVGSRCVAVIDSGGTRTIGLAVRAAIRTVTPLPVCYVIHTHVHSDHSFGDAAFSSDPATVFVAHGDYPAALAARREGFMVNLQRLLGAEAAAGSGSAVPTRRVSDLDQLDLGDRILRLQAWPTAHTNHDLSVFDERSRTLFTGDLLFIERIPVVDGSVRGWLHTLDALQALDAAHLVPGHGPVDRPAAAAFEAQRGYLQQLVTDVRAALKAGMTLAQTVDSLGRQQPQWLLAEDFHRRNVTAVYTELEWED